MGQVGSGGPVSVGGVLLFLAGGILIEYGSTVWIVALIVKSAKDSDVRVVSLAINYWLHPRVFEHTGNF